MEREPRIKRDGVDRPNSQDTASMSELLRQLGQESANLVRQEANLAKLEVKDTVQQLAQDGVTLAIGLGLLATGGLALTAFLILVLGELLAGAYWASALIIGAIFAIAGALLARSAVKDMKRQEITPSETIDTLKEDQRWLKQEARDFRRETMN